MQEGRKCYVMAVAATAFLQARYEIGSFMSVISIKHAPLANLLNAWHTLQVMIALRFKNARIRWIWTITIFFDIRVCNKIFEDGDSGRHYRTLDRFLSLRLWWVSRLMGHNICLVSYALIYGRAACIRIIDVEGQVHRVLTILKFEVFEVFIYSTFYIKKNVLNPYFCFF